MYHKKPDYQFNDFAAIISVIRLPHMAYTYNVAGGARDFASYDYS